MSKSDQDVKREQESLLYQIRDISALVEVCRSNKDMQETAEMGAVSEVLMMASNKLHNLTQEQTAKLDGMNK